MIPVATSFFFRAGIALGFFLAAVWVDDAGDSARRFEGGDMVAV